MRKILEIFSGIIQVGEAELHFLAESRLEWGTRIKN